jgi:hypothetical protein
VLAAVTSVMNFGIGPGALLAAGLAGRFALQWRIAPRALPRRWWAGRCSAWRSSAPARRTGC